MRKLRMPNIYGLGIVIILALLVFFIWLYGTNLTLGYTDTAYHLATAQGFSRAGGVVFWDFWESLPLGRPHLYPPLFHIVLATLLKFGFDPVFSIKFMMGIVVIGGLSIFAWGIKKLFNLKVAFWAVFLLAMSVNFVRLSATVMPAAIILFLAPALFYFLVSKKWVSYVVLLTFIFYLHMFMPYVVALSIFLYLVLVDRKDLVKAAVASVIAFAFYLPWLIHILAGGIEYIKYFDSNYSFDRWKNYADINLLILLLIILGLIFGFKTLRDKQRSNFLFFVILFIAISVLSFFASNRTINGHLLVPSAVIAAIFLAEIQFNEWPFYVMTGLALTYVFFTPYFRIQKDGPDYFLTDKGLLSAMATPGWLGHRNWEKIYSPLISGLQEAAPGTSLVSLMKNFGNQEVEKNYQVHISNYFEGFSGVSTMDLYDPEVHHRPAPDLGKAGYLLTSLPIDDIDVAYLSYLGYTDPQSLPKLKHNFLVAASLPIGDKTYYLLKNKNIDIVSENVPKHRLPLLLADLIVLVMTALIVIDNKRTIV